MFKSLVSIIIPTYNRAHLIGETLDSVLAQTYLNWECIIVDDGSTDDTDKLIAEYIEKDSRIQYHHRPNSKRKGGSACRNYGLQLAKGTYINWFDSDDLMKENFLSLKVETLEREQADFVVSKSLNFDKEGTYEVNKYKGNLQYQLTGKNYILKNIYWMTPDFFIKKEFLKGYYFNETLQSGQETNFFIVFLNTIKLKGVAIDEHLCFRRLHSTSIQHTLKESNESHRGKIMSLLASYNSIYNKLDNETKKSMQGEIITVCYKLKLKRLGMKNFLTFTSQLVFHKNPLKAGAFFLSLVLNSYFNSGHKLFEYSRL